MRGLVFYVRVRILSVEGSGSLQDPREGSDHPSFAYVRLHSGRASQSLTHSVSASLLIPPLTFPTPLKQQGVCVQGATNSGDLTGPVRYGGKAGPRPFFSSSCISLAHSRSLSLSGPQQLRAGNLPLCLGCIVSNRRTVVPTFLSGRGAEGLSS
jgi:hypothetical protein